jgi:hypothetical protein
MGQKSVSWQLMDFSIIVYFSSQEKRESDFKKKTNLPW